MFVENASDFVSLIKYHFSRIFFDNIFGNEIEKLFIDSRKMKFNLDVLYSISNDILHMLGKFGLSTLHEKRSMFLDSSAHFTHCFYFDLCKLLRLCAFLYMHERFMSNVDYSAESFKIINKPYLEYCTKKFNK